MFFTVKKNMKQFGLLAPVSAKNAGSDRNTSFDVAFAQLAQRHF